MSRYSQMVTAVGQARERMQQERARVEMVHEWLLRTLTRELGVDRDVVRSSGLITSSHYLHQLAEQTVFKTNLTIRVQHQDPMFSDAGQAFNFELSYAIGFSQEHRNVAVTVSIGGTSFIVKDEDGAGEVAQEMVRGIEFVLRIGNAQSKVRPIFGS